MLLMMLTLVIASDIDGCDDAACHDCFFAVCFNAFAFCYDIVFSIKWWGC